MISIRNVSKEYGDFFALQGISLDISHNSFVALTGASGSGKSTLLNIIGLIDNVSCGEVFINGINSALLSERESAALRNELYGFIFQSFYLEKSYDVKKNIELPLILRGTKKSLRIDAVEKALATVGLSGKGNIRTGLLSGGEQQRVAIARAIIGEPKIILADEPCGNLDTKNADSILNILSALHKSGATIILVTHNPQHAKMAEREIMLLDGKIIKDA